MMKYVHVILMSPGAIASKESEWLVDSVWEDEKRAREQYKSSVDNSIDARFRLITNVFVWTEDYILNEEEDTEDKKKSIMLGYEHIMFVKPPLKFGPSGWEHSGEIDMQ